MAKNRTVREEMEGAFAQHFPLGNASQKEALMTKMVVIIDTVARAQFNAGVMAAKSLAEKGLITEKRPNLDPNAQPLTVPRILDPNAQVIQATPLPE